MREGRALAESTSIALVANLKEHEAPNGVLDPQTEYLSEEELRELLDGFRLAGFYTEAFTDEWSFLHWLLDVVKTPPLGRRHAVYSIAQRGAGPGRHALIPAAAILAGMTSLTPEPYFGCLAHHKYHAYSLLSAAQLPIPKTWCFDSGIGWLTGKTPPIGLDVIAKPNLESASIGIDEHARFVYSAESDQILLTLSRQLRQPIVVQEFISGWETETPVIACRNAFALDPVGISLDSTTEMGDRFLDYSRVYDDRYRFFDFAEVSLEMSATMRRLAADAVMALNLTGIARIDFRIDKSGHPYITDITGKPHLTKHSAVASRFEMLGYDYADVFAALVGVATELRDLGS